MDVDDRMHHALEVEEVVLSILGYLWSPADISSARGVSRLWQSMMQRVRWFASGMLAFQDNAIVI